MSDERSGWPPVHLVAFVAGLDESRGPHGVLEGGDILVLVSGQLHLL